MPGLRDVLDRFRPAGTPGAATSGVGVPADRRAAAAAELEPVFAELARVARQCAALRREADDEATHLLGESTARARTLVTQARHDAAAERATAAARRRDEAAIELTRIRTEAEAAARAEYRRAEQRLPALVERIAAAVRADLAGAGQVDVAQGSSGGDPQ